MTEPVEDVRRIWSTVLATEVQDVDVNFFDAGGHSLLVMVLQEHLEELFGREISIEDLFEAPTIRAQAHLLTGSSDPKQERDSGFGAHSRSRLIGRGNGRAAAEDRT
ncbi:acyl carrier protein [Streptomyces sp. PTM05]|uniref:Acyl carrier protein n=1 Tax=Streptantibioticus parmotrematis TaxID=2873249 RepID=A0ABS7QNH5_9ACTN|nr:acyl carrier protein [Streptantibioticus parmotrematis]MBY8884723.1 acyl carrier protein [Streptantibioticus parmotrematis]